MEKTVMDEKLNTHETLGAKRKLCDDAELP